VLAAAGAVAAAVAFWPFASGPARPGTAAAQSGWPAALDRGRIVALDSAGYLVLADRGGAHVTRLYALGNVGQAASAAPDDRYFSLGNGQVAIVRNDATLAAYPSKVPLSGNMASAWPDSFADHDRDLVMLLDYGDSSYSAQNPVSVVSVATGRSQSLGVAHAVAGDPQSPGVFASVAAPPTASATVTRVTPDSRIELRAAGRPAVVLATAGGLDRDLGYPRSLSAALVPYPSPSGTEIAVTVLPAAGGMAGIVILSRSGRVLGTAAGSVAPPAWSPSGTSLAYAATGSGGSALRIWKAGGRTVTLTLPLPPTGGSFSRYIWSPDGMSVLCAPSFEADSGDWEVASAAGGSRPLAVRGPGLPVAWLPLAGGR
jgi:hypothetical protein